MGSFEMLTDTPEHDVHETELHLNSHTVALGVGVYVRLKGKHKLCIINTGGGGQSVKAKSHYSLLDLCLE